MGDKSMARSMTILAAVAFAILQTLESMGVIPVGALESITTCGKSVAGLLTVFGMRRAISANGLGVIFGDDSDPDLEEDPEDYELTDEDFEDEEVDPEGREPIG